MYYTKTELESLIDAYGRKSYFELHPKEKRDLLLEQRVLETYSLTVPSKKGGGQTATQVCRFRYQHNQSDNAKYTAFIEYMELYISALGNENLEVTAVEYWKNNDRLSTMIS